MIAGFWAFYVVWDGKIELWETLTFLLMYVFYIIVVLFGRYINQKIKVSRGISISKNDFSSERPTNSRINQEDLVDALNEEASEEEYENLTRPLLSGTVSNIEIPAVEFSNGISLKEAIIPFDKNEWHESNFLFKFMIIVKVIFWLICSLISPNALNYFLFFFQRYL